jgi:hypothetical protein
MRVYQRNDGHAKYCGLKASCLFLFYTAAERRDSGSRSLSGGIEETVIRRTQPLKTAYCPPPTLRWS